MAMDVSVGVVFREIIISKKSLPLINFAISVSKMETYFAETIYPSL